MKGMKTVKNNNRMRAICLLLAALMVTGVTGCGKKESGNETSVTAEKEGVVYQAEWLPREAGEDNVNYSQIVVKGEDVFFTRGVYTDTASRTELCSMSLDDPSASIKVLTTLAEYQHDNDEAETEESGEENEDDKETVNEEKPSTQSNITMAVPITTDTFFVLEEESPAIEADYEDESFDWEKYYSDIEKNTRRYLKKISADGTEILKTEITDIVRSEDNDYFYVQYGFADENGQLYLSDGNTAVWIFDGEGNLVQKVSIENTKNYSNVISMNLINDGRLAVLQYGADDMSMELRMFDPEKNAFGEAYTGLPANCYNSSLSSTEDGKILLNNSEGAFSYDPETQTYTQILKWLDCDLTPDFVRGIYALEGGNYLVYYQDWNTNCSDFIRLKKTDAKDVVQKEVLTIGAIYSGQDLQAAVVDFNKNSDKYRIEIKDYTSSIEYSEATYEKDYNDALTQFNNDIVSGKLDMFATDSVNIGNLIAKGAIEDLNPYLDNSTLDKSNLMESVIDAIEREGILYCIPQCFSITMLVGRTEDLGDRTGWTMADVKALCDQYPNASIMPNATREQVLYMLLMYDFDSYVDWQNGTCSFDQEAFKQLLELAAKYPSNEEFDWDKDYVSSPKLLRNHDALLESCYIGQINDWKLEEQIFGCPVTFIGYPSSSFNGVAANISGGICISSASKNKDVCWQFIESGILNATADSMYNYGFSIRKDLFAKQAEQEMKTGGGGYGWDDVEITLEAPVQADVDEVQKLIDRIEGISTYDQDTNLMNIITEEADAYFTGQKSLEDVTSIIQSRANIYINENR